MAKVIVRTKKIRRPIRFQHRRRQFPVHDLVFVGINHIGFPVVLQQLDCTKQGIRFEQIIVIEQCNPFTPGARKRRV